MEYLKKLDEVAASIRELENMGKDLLQSTGDQKGYATMMKKKATILRDLPETMKGLKHTLPSHLQSFAEDRVERFSLSATQALKVESVFYMYALLYPEDYTEGEPNDLEMLIRDLQEG